MFSFFNIYSKILALVGILLFIFSFFFSGSGMDIMALFLLLTAILLARNNFIDFNPATGLWLYYGLLISVLCTAYFLWFFD